MIKSTLATVEYHTTLPPKVEGNGVLEKGKKVFKETQLVKVNGQILSNFSYIKWKLTVPQKRETINLVT